MTNEEMLMRIELEYMERFERGEAPSLEELVETYPDMREELVEFVLDYVSSETEADAEEPSEEALRTAAAARERALERILAEPESLVEARKACGEKLGTLSVLVNVPKDVLSALEKGVITTESVLHRPKLLKRLGCALGLVPERLRDLIAGARRRRSAVHNRALGAPKYNGEQKTFEEALRASPDLNEGHLKDWLSDDSGEQEDG